MKVNRLSQEKFLLFQFMHQSAQDLWGKEKTVTVPLEVLFDQNHLPSFTNQDTQSITLSISAQLNRGQSLISEATENIEHPSGREKHGCVQCWRCYTSQRLCALKCYSFQLLNFPIIYFSPVSTILLLVSDMILLAKTAK